MKINNWLKDNDYKETVEENYSAIINTYNKQITILAKFEEVNPSSEVLKKNSKENIEKEINEIRSL